MGAKFAHVAKKQTRNSKQSKRRIEMTFELPDLPYDYDALEPHIDEATMRIHHDKHHQAYINNLKAALDWRDSPFQDYASAPVGAVKPSGAAWTRMASGTTTEALSQSDARCVST